MVKMITVLFFFFPGFVQGTYTTKLEVHGRPGLICHAVLEHQYSVVDGIPPGHQMFE